MLTTAAARKAILDAMPAYGKESVAVAASIGKVLRQSVVAERDQPPFDRVTMDGIAISYADVENNTREFPIQAMQAAGDKQIALEAGKAIEIMTGASLPIGVDCIVPVERISVSNDIAMFEADYEAKQNQFIHSSTRLGSHERHQAAELGQTCLAYGCRDHQLLRPDRC